MVKVENSFEIKLILNSHRYNYKNKKKLQKINVYKLKIKFVIKNNCRPTINVASRNVPNYESTDSL